MRHLHPPLEVVEKASTCMRASYPRALPLLPPAGEEFAISTFSVRPSTTWPLNLFAAASASSALVISTKPNPRERPVSRSVTTVADSTPPAAAKSSRRPSSVVAKDNPPINSLFANGLTSFEGCVASGSVPACPFLTYILYYSSTIYPLIYKREARPGHPERRRVNGRGCRSGPPTRLRQVGVR